MNDDRDKIKLNSYKNYMKFLKIDIKKNCKWIYDIIDKNKDADLSKLLYENKNFVLIMRKYMSPKKLSTFHLLAFVKDKKIKSIRDLKIEHIPLLKEIVKKSKEYIKRNYKIESNEIETNFHYRPTTLLLHIHFELVNNKKLRKPILEHSVHSVIKNLSVDPYYYKKNIETLNRSLL